MTQIKIYYYYVSFLDKEGQYHENKMIGAPHATAAWIRAKRDFNASLLVGIR